MEGKALCCMNTDSGCGVQEGCWRGGLGVAVFKGVVGHGGI